MMITVFEGRAGSGLTTALLYFLDKEKSDGKEIVVSRFDDSVVSGLKEHRRFSLQDSELYSTRKDLAFFLDETYQWWDCRMSMSSKNRWFTYLVSHHKKNNSHFYLSARSVSMLDKRIRNRKELIVGSCFSSKKKQKIYVDFSSTLDRIFDRNVFSEDCTELEGEDLKNWLNKPMEEVYEFGEFLLPEMDFDDVLEISVPEVCDKFGVPYIL